MTELTLEQMKANRKLWVEALRSGKYEQATGTLRDGLGFCCLGVACETLAIGWDDDVPKGFRMNGYLPFPIAKRFGLDDETMHKFVRWNDTDRKSFDEIADIIESEPPGLFVDEAS